MSTTIQLFWINRIQITEARELPGLPPENNQRWVRTLTAWDDEGHKTEIDLFTTSPENLHFIGGPQ